MYLITVYIGKTSYNPRGMECDPRGIPKRYGNRVYLLGCIHTSWSAHSKRYGAPKRYGPQGRSPRGMECIPRGMAGATQEVYTCSPRHMTCNPRGMHPNRHLQEVWNALQEVCQREVVIPLGAHVIPLGYTSWVAPNPYLLECMGVTQEVWQWYPRGMNYNPRGMTSVTQEVCSYLLGNRYTSWVTPNSYLLGYIMQPKRYTCAMQEVCTRSPRGIKTQCKGYRSYLLGNIHTSWVTWHTSWVYLLGSMTYLLGIPLG